MIVEDHWFYVRFWFDTKNAWGYFDFNLPRCIVRVRALFLEMQSERCG